MTRSNHIESFNETIKNARSAYSLGNHREARRWAERAVSIAPNREEPWLLLAAVASPKGSIAYLNRALEINPQSTRARQGMVWAVKRLRSINQTPGVKRKIFAGSPTPDDLTKTRNISLPWTVALIVILFGLIGWFGSPPFSLAFNNTRELQVIEGDISKATITPSPTSTFTPTATFTFTPTPTDTPTPTLTPTNTPTSTPSNTPTKTRRPTNTLIPPTDPPYIDPIVKLPDGVSKGEVWIDVNLTRQTTYAYRGKNLLNSFIVSTGTWQHPTVIGTFRIYVKYRYADMAGPGYYLPDVPYVMYFYKGYGLHGTYWHNNFGTPMSHGCVNFTINDAGWVFNNVSVGTVVNVHY